MNFDFPFIFFATGRSIPWYWEQCDTAAQVVIGVIALFLVIGSTVAISRWLYLMEANKKNSVVERNLVPVKKVSNMAIPEERSDSAPYALVVAAALKALKKHRGKIENEADVRVCVSQIENAIQRSVVNTTTRYEKGIGWLGAFVSAGPFLGLLGTVWGVMVTFGALTEKATISALAPGVSGALVATASGLLLAIPMSFAYNYLLGFARKMTTNLDNFASRIADEIETELLESLREKQNATDTAVPATKNDNPFLRDAVPATNSGSVDSSRPSWN